MCLDQGPQRSDAGEARTRGPSVSSQAFYHWATALPYTLFSKEGIQFWKTYAHSDESVSKNIMHHLRDCKLFQQTGGREGVSFKMS